MSGGSADTGYVEEPSPIVLQPVCAVQTNVGGCSYGDSDSDDDLTLSSSDAAYRAAHGHLLRLNSGMNGGKQVRICKMLDLYKNVVYCQGRIHLSKRKEF